MAEVKAICAVLFQAKINSLDNIRRERVSEDDLKGPQTDYLPDKSVTNELAVLSPYEVSFRCFSPELAAVLAGFASCALRPDGQDDQRRIGAGGGAGGRRAGAGGDRHPGLRSSPTTRQGPRQSRSPRQTALPSAMACEARRPRAQTCLLLSRSSRPMCRRRPAPASRGGLPLALDEKQLKVTLMLNAVKLVSPK